MVVKCKLQTITRKHKPICTSYEVNDSTIKSGEVDRDLGVSLDCDLTWHAQVSDQAARANKLLGFVRRNSRFIHSTSVRRTLYLGLVRAHLGYATQAWAPQGIELISILESIHRRATKFILCLPFLTNISWGKANKIKQNKLKENKRIQRKEREPESVVRRSPGHRVNNPLLRYKPLPVFLM